MPRWLLLGLLATAAVVALLNVMERQRPRVPEACLAAEAAMEAQDYNRAIDNYLLCLDSEELPEAALAQVYLGLGIAYTAKGNHYQAIEDYGQSIELDPSNAWAYNNRCWSLALLRRAEEALEDCEAALRLLPDQPEILDSRALAHWLLRDEVKARRDLERARELAPNVPTWEERFREFEELY